MNLFFPTCLIFSIRGQNRRAKISKGKRRITAISGTQVKNYQKEKEGSLRSLPALQNYLCLSKLPA
jgi:alanyl-tRNA synthetase